MLLEFQTKITISSEFKEIQRFFGFPKRISKKPIVMG
jgi:hypothetical protein